MAAGAKRSKRKDSRLKKWAIQIFKFGLVAVLLLILARKGFLDLERTAHSLSRLEFMGPAFLLLTIAAVLGIVRWKWLLGSQGIEMGFGRIFQLAMVGNFFNIALPGAVSGDFVKAIYIAREVPGSRAKAFGSILFDRLVGLSALVFLSAGMTLADRSEIAGTGLFPAVRLFILVPALIFLISYGYLFFITEKRDPVLKILVATEDRWERFGSVTRIYQGLREYHHHRGVVLLSVASSILIHALVAGANTFFLKALGVSVTAVMAIWIIVPIGLLFTAIPLGPAGVGTGHMAFSWLFQFLGTDRGADCFSLFALFQILFGLLGGLVYLQFRSGGVFEEAVE
ncbi:MAG: flippase-like domain-containing protein [Bdellovibrionales bacterium]|nr:flippase-like domain-containing protein [Bdellovibrionales bacterium]